MVRVGMFEYLRDVDYFGKRIEEMEVARAGEINRLERGEVQEEVNEEVVNKEKEEGVSNYEYLRRNLMPVLEGALRQVDLMRPEDPLAFIALYCLKNREKLE